VDWAKFVIPTQHNILAIEHGLMVAARRYVQDDRINLELERAVGRVVRAFDPVFPALLTSQVCSR
jgi:coenzyme F420-reducing hydrogenase alpha subunit